MINAKCQCGAEHVVGENTINGAYACPSCGRTLRLVCAEALADGAGAGDFDARLIITAGPSRVGEIIFVGGVMEIEIGKLAGKHIQLEANMVSRFHCKLVRIDFGPSRWKIVDNKSTNGLFVNRERIAEHELASGDQINIGGFQLEYSLAAPPAAEEPIDLGAMEEGEEPAEAVTTAAPPKVKKKKPKPQKLGYGRPAASGDVRLLNDSDPDWVKKIRLASNLLVLSIIINFLSGMSEHFASETGGILLGVGSALVNVLGIWFLTEPEPDAPEDSGHAVLRISLRIISIITAGGAFSVAASQFMNSPGLLFGGLGLLFAIPQFFLLLLYIRMLALRIPNDSLATQCLIVMIGFPGSIAVVIGGVLWTVSGHVAAFGAMGLCFGACSIITFALWYLVILVWFQKSLN